MSSGMTVRFPGNQKSQVGCHDMAPSPKLSKRMEELLGARQGRCSNPEGWDDHCSFDRHIPSRGRTLSATCFFTRNTDDAGKASEIHGSAQGRQCDRDPKASPKAMRLPEDEIFSRKTIIKGSSQPGVDVVAKCGLHSCGRWGSYNIGRPVDNDKRSTLRLEAM